MRQLIIFLLTFNLISSANGQTYAILEKALTAKFSETSTQDGRWVFHPDKANIEKIDKPLLNAIIPNYTFYKITLTNYLGSHINEENCVLLYDSAASEILLVEPLWYAGVSKPLIKLFINKGFGSKDQLAGFLGQLNELMEMGSGCKFILTGFSYNLITYDVLKFNGNYAGSGARPGRYNKDEVWKQIRIDIEDGQLIRYTSIDPKTNKKEMIK